MSRLTFCLGLSLLVFGSVNAGDNGHDDRNGWVNVGGRFLKYFATPMTFDGAKAECAKFGGLLAYDDHPVVSNHMAMRGGQQWIGGTDAGHEGKWTWTNGVSMPKGKWFKGEPNNCCGGQNCAVTNFRKPGMWDDQKCSSKKPFHCQVHRIGYAYMGNRVLKVHTEKKNWADAAATCHQEGGELVVVDHPSVNEWLAKQAPDNMWIGATDKGHEGSYTWSNGRAATKSYWSKNEPNNCCGGQNCAVVNFKGLKGKWDDQGCGTANSFACQVLL